MERDPEEPGEVPQLKVSSEGTVSTFATAKEKFLVTSILWRAAEGGAKEEATKDRKATTKPAKGNSVQGYFNSRLLSTCSSSPYRPMDLDPLIESAPRTRKFNNSKTSRFSTP